MEQLLPGKSGSCCCNDTARGLENERAFMCLAELNYGAGFRVICVGCLFIVLVAKKKKLPMKSEDTL